MDTIRKSPITIFILACWLITFFASYFLGLDLMLAIFGFYPTFPNIITGVFTYNLFVGNVITLFISGLMFFLFGADLEKKWGKKWYVIFLITASIGTIVLFEIFSLVINRNISFLISDGWFLTTAAIVAWCAINPEEDVRLWFVLPIKAKWLILVAVMIQVFTHWPILVGVSLTGGIIAAFFFARAMKVIPYGHHGKRVQRNKVVLKMNDGVTNDRERKQRTKQLKKTFKIDE